ncbi:MAG: HlyC/CorC family transporter [Acidobacteria bacterium]|nr:HlyC/CorC family transporter [Acidobacteriota bacterium]
MYWPFFKILLVLLLILANGFFVAVEFALIRVRRPRIEALANAGKPSARAVLRALDQLDAIISATQFGITLASLALGWVGESTLEHLFEPFLMRVLPPNLAVAAAHTTSAVLAFSIITYFHIVLGEFAPKALAIEFAERIALAVARPMQLFYRTFKPLIWIINVSGIRFIRAFGIKAALGHHAAYTEEELRQIVSASHESGHLGEGEKDLIHNVFEFTDLTAREVMIPRTKIVALEQNSGFAEVVNQFQLSGYSRLPVYQEHFDNIIGIVHSKDVMGYTLRPQEFDLKEITRPPVFIPDSAQLGNVLSRMQRDRIHLVIVVDEHAGVEGILTLEDLLEEIVGEIEDEHDETQTETSPQNAENGLSLDASLSVREANRKFNLHLPESEGYTTIAGFLIAEAGRLLNQGDIIEHKGSRFTIERVASRRITQVKMERLP